MDEWDELNFDSAFTDVGTRDLLDEDYYGSSLGTSLPSMGLGITPPTTFSFGDEFMDNKVKTEAGLKQTTKSSSISSPSSSLSTSRPIGIPGSCTNLNRTFGTAVDVNKDKSGEKKPFVGAYSPDSRRKRIEKFLDKRQKRVWRKEVKYDVRKNFADSRLRVKGRFVKKEDEQLLRELLSFT